MSKTTFDSIRYDAQSESVHRHGKSHAESKIPQVKRPVPKSVIIISVIAVTVIIIPLVVVVAVLATRGTSTNATTSSSGASGPPATTASTVTTIATTTATSVSTTVTVTSTTIATSTTTVSTTMSTTQTTTTAHVIPQCNQPQLINDTTRLTTAAAGTICDTNIFDSTLRWVRFVSPGGTQLPTSPPSWNTCGTMATGWMNATLPSSGVTINATVCFSAFGNNCYWISIMQVTNCGAYYVFGLYAPPGCDARYCTI